MTRLAILFATLLTASSSWALDLNTAKQQGWFGEQSNGYLGIVNQAPGVAELVQQVNQGRKKVYQSIATKNGVALGEIEVRAGQKALDKAKAGDYIESASGWRKK